MISPWVSSGVEWRFLTVTVTAVKSSRSYVTGHAQSASAECARAIAPTHRTPTRKKYMASEFGTLLLLLTENQEGVLDSLRSLLDTFPLDQTIHAIEDLLNWESVPPSSACRQDRALPFGLVLGNNTRVVAAAAPSLHRKAARATHGRHQPPGRRGAPAYGWQPRALRVATHSSAPPLPPDALSSLVAPLIGGADGESAANATARGRACLLAAHRVLLELPPDLALRSEAVPDGARAASGAGRPEGRGDGADAGVAAASRLRAFRRGSRAARTLGPARRCPPAEPGRALDLPVCLKYLHSRLLAQRSARRDRVAARAGPIAEGREANERPSPHRSSLGSLTRSPCCPRGSACSSLFRTSWLRTAPPPTIRDTQ